VDIISQFIDIFLHLDVYLGEIINQYGALTYAILFIIIFMETGVVVTPFLPGDSLLFAAASFAALGNLNIGILFVLLLVAAILGDASNYHIGKTIGSKLIEKDTRFIKKKHIDKTNSFYEKYGGKTIIIARFVPIVRTFAPFVAGIGDMHYKKFLAFNAIGATLWVSIALGAGYIFARNEFVKQNFSLVILVIIFISILPAVLAILKEKFKTAKAD
jgi:membrane-associated protein